MQLAKRFLTVCLLGATILVTILPTQAANQPQRRLVKQQIRQTIQLMQLKQYPQATRYLAKAGSFPAFKKITVTETGAITGKVFGLDSTALASAFVQAYSVDSIATGWFYGIATVQSNFTYKIDSLQAGEYFVCAWADGYQWLYYPNKTEMSEAKPVAVTAGDTIANIDFDMIRPHTGTGSISGTVVREKDSAAIERAIVNVFSTDSSTYTLNYCSWAETKEDGSYCVSDLKSGSYWVVVSANGYLLEYYNNAASIDEATLVTVIEPNETAGIDFALSAGGTISGKITTEDGRPVAGAYLEAMNASFDSVYTDSSGYFSYWGVGKAISDDNGNYSIAGLPTGDYFVLLTYWNDWSFITKWYDNADDIRQAKPITVQTGEEVFNIDFKLSWTVPIGVIAGRVTDLQDQPIAGVYMQIQSTDASGMTPGVWCSALTDSLGNYRIEQLPNGSYLVSAWAQSGWQYVQRWWPDAESPEQATPVLIDGNTDPGAINFRLPIAIGNATIAGLVQSSTGRPLAGASIQVSPDPWFSPVSNTRHSICAYGSSDSSGHYLIEGLPAGSYMIHTSYWEGDQFAEQWYDHADSLAAATAVDLASGEKQTGIDFTLNLKSRFGSIAGSVIDQTTGLPISRAYVEISALHHNYYSGLEFCRYWDYTAVTDADGKYQIDWLAEGNYLVSVYTNGAFEIYQDAVVAEEATPITVVGGDTAVVNLAVTPRNDGSGSITGKVVTEWDGTPLPIAVVTVKPIITITLWPQSAMFYTAVTNLDGTYELKNLPAGEYFVKSFAPWTIGEYYDNVYDPAQATTVQVDGTNPTPNIDFSLSLVYYLANTDSSFKSNGAAIVGKVTDSDGTPINDASVYILNQAGEAVSFVRTVADGSYALSGMPPGNYVLQVGKPGYESQFNGNAESFDQAQPLPVGSGVTEVNFSLAQTPVGVDENMPKRVPKTIELYGNYPNPFNPSTQIRFALPLDMNITVRIINQTGQEVARLYEGTLTAGTHNLIWSGVNRSGEPASSGLYFYRLESGKSNLVGKMILLR